VIDCGFTEETARKRKRTFLRDPIDALKLVGVDAGTVQDVVLTHLHYDHVGGFNRFPKAKVHLQEPEIHYATGRYMQHHRLAHSFEVEDIVGVVRLNFAHRVQFYNGGAELAPGITLHPVGGHSMGLQFVKVHTKRGWVVVASDTTHYYENMMTDRPFTTALHIGLMLEAYDTLRREAPSPQHIVPGHDPKVMQFYPPPSPELAGIVVRLDVTPDDAELANIKAQH
jgi:glyoxylase-like metal-dependent hydrolase (beta-lactamase superfamily II)